MNDITVTEINFRNESQIEIPLPIIQQPGNYSLFISENFGVDFLEMPVPLRYHPVPILFQANFNKIQIANCSDTEDLGQPVGLLLQGTNFPDNPLTPFYCAIGANLNGKSMTATIPANIINATFVECPNIN